MSAKRLFKIGSSSSASGAQKVSKDIICNVTVIGAENVGKTAFIVRYLTRKYLPEYSHGETVTYEKTLTVDGKFIQVRIADTPGKLCESVLKSNRTCLNHKEAYLVVYSVTEADSFVMAQEALKMLNSCNTSMKALEVPQQQQPTGPLIYLVGNKTDLSHIRCVSYNEGRKASLCYSETAFFECSVATGPDEAEAVFNDLLQKVFRRHSLLPRASLSGSLTVLTSWPTQTPRRNTFSATSSSGSGWWRRHRNSDNNGQRTDRTFTM